jgi:hypothetical protein
LKSATAGYTVSVNPLISVLLSIAVFSGFQGGRYFMANRLQEVGILSVLLVFILGAWLCLFRMPQPEWKRWVYTPCLLLIGIMLVWAVTFGIKYDDSVIYSIFASREFLLGFIGPAMYLITRAGYPLEHLQRVILFALLLLLSNYLYFYNTLDLRETFFSPDHTVSNLVTYDEWRGFRLKPPMFAVMLSFLVGLMLFFQGQSLMQRAFAAALVGLAAYIWTIVQFRSNLATLILAILVYWCFLVRPGRLHLALFLIPLGVIVAPVVAGIALTHFAEADGGALRLGSYKLALANILQNPVLGVGEDNSYGRTYQDLFARTFYPDDLGLIGILFKYGLVGTTLYLYFHGRICVSLWKANLAHKTRFGRHHPLLWALLIFMTSQTLNLPLIPGLAYAQGITTGSMAIALCALIGSDVPGSKRNMQ